MTTIENIEARNLQKLCAAGFSIIRWPQGQEFGKTYEALRYTADDGHDGVWEPVTFPTKIAANRAFDAALKQSVNLGRPEGFIGKQKGWRIVRIRHTVGAAGKITERAVAEHPSWKFKERARNQQEWDSLLAALIADPKTVIDAIHDPDKPFADAGTEGTLLQPEQGQAPKTEVDIVRECSHSGGCVNADSCHHGKPHLGDGKCLTPHQCPVSGETVWCCGTAEEIPAEAGTTNQERKSITFPSGGSITAAATALPESVPGKTPQPVLIDTQAPAHVTALQRSGAQNEIGEGATQPVCLDLIRTSLDLAIPTDPLAIAACIRDQVRGEREAGLRAAVLSALIRLQKFPDKKQYREYVEWMAENAGVQWRQAVTYQNAGTLLWSPAFADLPKASKERLLLCTATKLEIIAGAGPDRLSILAAQPELAELSVENLRKMVAEKMLSSSQQKLLATAQADKAKKDAFSKSPAGRCQASVSEINKLEGLIDPEAVEDPLAAIRAGFILQQAAFQRLEVCPAGAKLAELSQVVASLDEVLTFARGLLAKKG